MEYILVFLSNFREYTLDKICRAVQEAHFDIILTVIDPVVLA